MVEDTMRVSEELANGGDFEKLVKTYRFRYSHVED